ncbi:MULTISPECIES: hypothetical protein [unclassified Mesorhizobium]|uniref:hypothetical protein n=1 Tax=unclassified Mesorhizobium TaxID=325217 RepID=UPI001FDF88E8|nr:MULTISPECIES: hypothetical protein [unclassified Mesorhizobium]
MNIALPAEGTDLSPYLPDEHGLFFIYHFKADGSRTADPAEAHWSWRSYQITDMRARHEIGGRQGRLGGDHGPTLWLSGPPKTITKL